MVASQQSTQDQSPQGLTWPTSCRWGFGLAFGVLLLSDLISKALLFPPAGVDLHRWQQQHDWPSWIHLAYNTGVAWSLFDHMPDLVAGLTVLLVPIIAAVWWRSYRQHGLMVNIAFGLILGGAIGNAYDRLVARLFGSFPGVRDFISVDLNSVGIDYIWPTFNLADSGICLGFGLLLLASWLPGHGVTPPTTTSSEPTDLPAPAAPHTDR
jgi:lipoprotein signal peptidase